MEKSIILSFQFQHLTQLWYSKTCHYFGSRDHFHRRKKKLHSCFEFSENPDEKNLHFTIIKKWKIHIIINQSSKPHNVFHADFEIYSNIFLVLFFPWVQIHTLFRNFDTDEPPAVETGYFPWPKIADSSQVLVVSMCWKLFMVSKWCPRWDHF